MCLEKTVDAQQEYSLLKCGHTIHSKCMKNAQENNIYKCGICRKSMFDMNNIWDFIRSEIELQPITTEHTIISEGQTVKTPYGLMMVTRVNETNEMVSGKLYITPNSYGTFRKKNLMKMVDIYCNDCDIKTLTEFHFIGNRCYNCNGFNTLIL
jgi:hypothetical protein